MKRVRRRRLGFALPAVLAAWLLLPWPALSQGGQQVTAGPFRDLAACNCPKLAVINDDAHAAPGKNADELTYDDLHALFGTRDVRYGNWANAIAALEQEIDPGGALGIAKQPQPAVVDQRPIVEAVAAHALITGELPAPGERLPNPFNSRWAYERGYSEQVQADLIWTLARAEKYGEPAAGMRDAALRLAHFLAIDLAPSQALSQSTDPRVRRIRPVNGGAILATIAAINLAGPYPAFVRGRESRLNAQRDLPISDFDRAQAALEVLTFGDDQHDIDPSLLAAPAIGGRPQFETLLSVAAAAQRFGGPAAPDSDMGIVACRAYSALVTYLSAKGDAAMELRRSAMKHAVQTGTAEWNNASLPFAHAQFNTLVALINQTGPATTQEAIDEVDGVATLLVKGHSDDERQRMADLLSAIITSTGDAAPSARTKSDTVRQEMIKRQEEGNGDDQERRGIQFWPSGAVAEGGTTTSRPASAGPACSTGSCNAEISSEDGKLAESFEWQPAITVVSSSRPNQAGGIDAVARDEPFTINVAVPQKEDPGEMAVHIEGSGGSSDYALRYENTQNGIVLYTSMSPVTFEHGGGGAWGFVRKLMHTPFLEWFGHMHGDFRKMNTTDGETVKLTVRNVTVPLAVYDYTWTERIANNNRSTNALWAYYDDLLQNATIPQSMKGQDGPIHRRLRWIANYRQIMEYEPPPDSHLIFSMVTKANIGDAYLALIQTTDEVYGRELDQQVSRIQTFPNVSYVSSVEAKAVTDAVDDAQREVKEDLWHNFAQLAIAYYDGVLAGSCFLIKNASGGFAPCADQVWTLLTGTDIHGNEVSGSSYAVAALDVAEPYISAGASAAIELYAEQSVHDQLQLRAINQKAAQAAAATEEFELARRSQWEAEQVLADFQDVDVTVGALNSREKLRVATPPTLTGSVEATGVAGPPMLMQKYDNNCFLTALEYVRRRRGLPPMTQEQMIAAAYRFQERGRTFLSDFRIYNPRGGTSLDGRRYLPQIMGLEVETVDGLMSKGFLKQPHVNVAQMKNALLNGHEILASVESTSPISEKLMRVLRAAGKSEREINAHRSYHAVVVVDVFKDSGGVYRVTYGDPWNGKFWTVDACTFDIRSRPTATLIIR